MVDKTIDSVQKLYSENVKSMGVSSESVGWPDADQHKLRFDKLCAGFNFNAIDSINDLGSGYGALLTYLEEKKLSLKAYNAYDISQEMLDALKVEKFPNTEIHKFKETKLKTKADFSVASGIFNVRFKETDNAWQNFILETLHNLNDFSTKGFSFNLLTSYVDFKREHLFYGDPTFFFDYCKKHFSRYVTLHHDYPLWEWTIVVQK